MASTAVALGVLQKVEKGMDVAGKRSILLGLTAAQYVFTDDASVLQTFLDEARAVTPSVNCIIKSPPPSEQNAQTITEDIIAHGKEVRKALQHVGKQTNALKTKGGDGYVTDFLVRKMVLGRLSQSYTPGSDQGWDDVSITDLRQVSADSREHLATLPDRWSATQAREP